MIDPTQAAPVPDIRGEELTDGMAPEIHISYQITIAANLMAFGSSTRNFKQFGLNVGEWRILAALPRTGPLTAGQIVEIVGQDKANVSRSIAGLSEKQLIIKTPNPSHKRSPIIWLTHAGQELYKRIVPVFTEQAEMFCAVLTQKEKVTLCRLLDKLKAHTEKVRQQEGL
jgi:DNA-binding MarR family transcriptional regulator